jgi:hypothetical protein
MLHRHEKYCKGGVRYKQPGEVYHTTKTVFEELEDEGIIVPPEHRYRNTDKHNLLIHIYALIFIFWEAIKGSDNYGT